MSEAARRLLTRIAIQQTRHHSVERLLTTVDAALATERKATVERIRAALHEAHPPTGSHIVAINTILAILDAEAAQ